MTTDELMSWKRELQRAEARALRQRRILEETESFVTYCRALVAQGEQDMVAAARVKK